MKRIAIIGNSISGVRAIEKIRSVDQQSELTLFTLEEHLPYQRHLFADFLAREIKDDELLCKPIEFYQDHRVDVVLGNLITRVNLNKKRIMMSDNRKLNYDVILITDSGDIHLPGIKGNNKTGVFGLWKFADIKQINMRLPLVETVTVTVSNLLGLKTACAINARGKKVIVMIPSGDLLSNIFDKQTFQVVLRALKEKGIRVIHENLVDEIIGDGEVKAIRLESKKVIASQMVIFDSIRANLRMFVGRDLKLEEGICVAPFFKTSIDDVFALNGACSLSQKKNLGDDPGLLERQGEVVGDYINGQVVAYEKPLIVRKFFICDLSIILIGETTSLHGFQEYYQADGLSNKHKKIFTKDNFLVGAILINYESESDKIIRAMKDKINILGIEQEFLEEESSYAKAFDSAEKEMPLEVANRYDKSDGFYQMKEV